MLGTLLHFVSYGLQYVLIKQCQNTLPELLGRLIIVNFNHSGCDTNNDYFIVGAAESMIKGLESREPYVKTELSLETIKSNNK